MSYVQTLSDLANVEDPAEFIRFSSSLLASIVDTVNGNLEFDKNIKSQIIEFNFTSANSDLTKPHNLGHEPTGFIVVSKSAAGDVYDGSSWSPSTITLRCTTTIDTKVIVF